MVTKLFGQPHILYQKVEDDMSLPEPAIAASVDAGGIIILGQEGREILVNRSSAKELAKLIMKLAVAP